MTFYEIENLKKTVKYKLSNMYTYLEKIYKTMRNQKILRIWRSNGQFNNFSF